MDKQIYTCGYKPCGVPFQPTPSQIGNHRRGDNIYCCPDHGALARAEKARANKHQPKQAQETTPEPPKPIIPDITPFGAHPNSVLSFAL